MVQRSEKDNNTITAGAKRTQRQVVAQESSVLTVFVGPRGRRRLGFGSAPGVQNEALHAQIGSATTDSHAVSPPPSTPPDLLTDNDARAASGSTDPSRA